MFLLFSFPFTGLSYDFTNPEVNCTTKWNKFSPLDDSIVQKSSKNVAEVTDQELFFPWLILLETFPLFY